jgi:hypothetical protein
MEGMSMRKPRRIHLLLFVLLIFVLASAEVTKCDHTWCVPAFGYGAGQCGEGGADREVGRQAGVGRRQLRRQILCTRGTPTHGRAGRLNTAPRMYFRAVKSGTDGTMVGFTPMVT